MADGSSGLSLSEMGISTVKKTAQIVKKIGSPIAQQVKKQIGGANVPIQSGQSTTSGFPNENVNTNGGFDSSMFKNETNIHNSSTSQQGTQQQSQNIRNNMASEQQNQQDQQQIDLLRKKLHNMYFEDFINKAEGNDRKQQEDTQRKRQMEQQDEEERKRKDEQDMEPVEFSQSPKKGFGKKVKSSLMKLLKPKQGSHESKSSKG